NSAIAQSIRYWHRRIVTPIFPRWEKVEIAASHSASARGEPRPRRAGATRDEGFMSGTRQASKVRTRNRLVKSAIRVLHRSGASALTTGKIAADAGVAQPTFYVHFEDMKALLQEVATTISSTIIARMQ